ncbi:MAG: peptide deformylase [Treponema sp.]|nr:peptide deformylase [Treponema sp.]
MILRVTKLGEDILRQVAQPVTEVNDEIRQLAQDMFETMIEYDGVGLACPQVGKSLRMFVVIADDDVKRVFINPQIIKTSSEVSDYDEGCLSIPQVYETITRPVKVTVQAMNENGKVFTLDADGLLARIIQHEYDHLEGILYIDRGDKDFAEKTTAQFKKRLERSKQKEKEKALKAQRIAAKIAAKEAKKNK